MDYDTFDTDIFSEINDAPGEIFDVIEYKEEYEEHNKFDVESYINGDTDYWYQWTIVKVSTKPAQTPKIVYLIGVEGTAPHHFSKPLLSASHA